MLTLERTSPDPPVGPTLRVLTTDDSFAQTGAVTLPASIVGDSPPSLYQFVDLVPAGADTAFIVRRRVTETSSIVIAHAPVVATGGGGPGGSGGACDAGGTNRVTPFRWSPSWGLRTSSRGVRTGTSGSPSSATASDA
jgi:hypothetical protein